MVKPLVSIISVHYKTPQTLEDCLVTLQKLKDETPLEIIIVNNDQISFKKLKTICEKWSNKARKITLIQSPKNLGFGAGNNLGAKKARGKFLFFLNPDTEVKNGCVDKLANFLQTNQGVGMAAPTLLEKKDQPFLIQGSQELNPISAIMSHSLIHALWPNNPVARRHFLRDIDRSKDQKVKAVPGSAFFIRLSLFKKVGGFDKNFFLYFEEYDLGQKVTKAGFDIYILAKPKVLHYWQVSTNQVKKVKVKNKFLTIKQIHQQSRFYYFKKHFGLLKALITEFFLRLSSWHLILISIIGIYIALMLSVLNWGIPSDNQIFTYQMDEWHQLMSLKNIALQGSPNIAGSAHGPLWNFLLAGAYLFFFYILGLVNPYLINSPIDNLMEQQKIFQLLRINTMLFGAMTLITIFLILKKQLRHQPLLGLILFTFTPIWLSLSNYFKYDIALIFWISLTFYYMFKFARENNLKNFLFISIGAALSLATKVSALPIIPILLFSYFYYQKNWQKNLGILGWGISAFILTFALVGIPDLWLGTGDYTEYFSSNLINNPSTTANFKLNTSYQWFLLIDQLPLIFGRVFTTLGLGSLFYTIYQIIKCSFTQPHALLKKYRHQIFSLFSLLIFVLSLAPLKIYATGNRMLVLLPLLTLLISFTWNEIYKQAHKNKRIILAAILTFAILFQIYEAISWLNIKWQPDPRQTSVNWIHQNLDAGSTIGIENVPIYQRIPNIFLTEYYSDQYNQGSDNLFSYQVITAQDKSLPPTIVITNSMLAEYQFSAAQKDLLQRLNNENYKLLAMFEPQLSAYQSKRDSFSFIWTNLVPTTSIKIYQRSNNDLQNN